MKEDTIKRSDAIKAMQECFQVLARQRAQAVKMIEAIPSADRPQGEWVMGNRPLEGNFRIFRCSVCGYEPFYKGEPITPTNMTLLYYPNCGARMKGADDE